MWASALQNCAPHNKCFLYPKTVFKSSKFKERDDLPAVIAFYAKRQKLVLEDAVMSEFRRRSQTMVFYFDTTESSPALSNMDVSDGKVHWRADSEQLRL
jgi:hypothetical protein